MFQLLFQILYLTIFINPITQLNNQPSFTVDYEHNQFLKDGRPFRYVSGSMHYFRVPKEYWKDRMLKMKAAGLNSLQTYVEWSSHEPELGTYTFSDNNDVFTFLQTAQEVGLLVILRPGPYICAEREFGGLPYWLLREKPNIALRTSDPNFLYYLDNWFDVLLPLIKPFLYENGGPIIMVQIENEYGEFGCDYEYLNHLRDLLIHYLGNKIIIFRTDVPDTNYYKCDNIDNVLTSADFGPNYNVTSAFETVRIFQQHGPLTVTEYYAGWMDTWGHKHFIVDIDNVCKTLDKILSYNASVNFYMFHGGTNFAFTNGANPSFNVLVTSYDYSSCLSEAGDPTELYYAVRNIIGKYVPLPPEPPPKPSPKLALGPLNMKYLAPLLHSMIYLGIPKTVFSKYPKTFEEISQAYGFVSYSTVIEFIPTSPSVLNATGLNDRGYIFVDNKFQAILSREMNIFHLPLKISRNQILTILVENQGRLDSATLDFKGLTSNVTLGGKVLTQWLIQSIPLNNTKLIHNLDKIYHPRNPEETSVKVPGFFSVNFTLPNGTLLDSFLNLRNWTKGVAFLNGFNLGRYWPVMGPQVTLYTPATLFNPYPQQNNLVLLELESTSCNINESCTIEFVNQPILDGPTPIK
ncbi:beta-galactosidase-like [Centruroides sculpturatus]|uniref:beta-galactosidase-like n=1 Tax=Centruroides sculpturatus TaxID=218467 RepID=UPI000C6CACE3|nr:beta-galactosidase-like [Centruroides sculpturatus]XP_023235784.1 beta-galactosidase-like [Centruroides sculpturatus]XP_023235785.1 beta-galactosidase-like [Centruroides sculpturatus]XP_023235786.1 beta-galactosidase-like [Centruroides sculpturatus]XP_023235787.1 beta-galactosidase-like [Centruroides sculpturatus]